MVLWLHSTTSLIRLTLLPKALWDKGKTRSSADDGRSLSKSFANGDWQEEAELGRAAGWGGFLATRDFSVGIFVGLAWH